RHRHSFEGTSAYVATDDLKVAVNAAITLERPLLVKGEPGTGKTVLALEVASGTSNRLPRRCRGFTNTTRCRGCAPASSATGACATFATTSSAASCGTPSSRMRDRCC